MTNANLNICLIDYNCNYLFCLAMSSNRLKWYFTHIKNVLFTKIELYMVWSYLQTQNRVFQKEWNTSRNKLYIWNSLFFQIECIIRFLTYFCFFKHSVEFIHVIGQVYNEKLNLSYHVLVVFRSLKNNRWNLMLDYPCIKEQLAKQDITTIGWFKVKI